MPVSEFVKKAPDLPDLQQVNVDEEFPSIIALILMSSEGEFPPPWPSVWEDAEISQRRPAAVIGW